MKAIPLLIRAGAMLAMLWTSVFTHAAGCIPLQGPGYVGEFDRNKPSVVVFVHGVLSSSAGAWDSGPPESTVWPCLIRTDSEFFAESNLYVHEYPADLSESPSIDEVANRLYRDLVNSGYFDRGIFGHSHVTFIAHSMGGLVVTRMLMRPDFQRGDLARIRLLMLYGTPGNGADLATIGKYLSGNKQFAEMANVPDLKSWSDRFNSTPWTFHRLCLAEGADVGFMGSWWSRLNPFSVRVVPRESAAALCAGQAVDLTGLDHMAIVKPTPKHIEPHRQLRLQYSDCVRHLLQAKAEALNPPDAVMDQAAQWLNALRLDLEAPPAGSDRITALMNRLDATVASYPMPKDVKQPSFYVDDYRRWPGRAFASEVESFLRQFPLSESAIEWVSTARSARARLADQAFAQLLGTPGMSMESDIVVALQSTAASMPGKALFILRMAQPADGKWLRGMLWVPANLTACGKG